MDVNGVGSWGFTRSQRVDQGAVGVRYGVPRMVEKATPPGGDARLHLLRSVLRIFLHFSGIFFIRPGRKLCRQVDLG